MPDGPDTPARWCRDAPSAGRGRGAVPHHADRGELAYHVSFGVAALGHADQGGAGAAAEREPRGWSEMAPP
ncbi:hypothetical protein NKH77_07210 [Streptomyces sp. M19]